jgi:hypothetical protein
MVAFQISINGEPYCESDDITTLTMVAEEQPRGAGYRISLHAAGPEAPVQWLTSNMKVGDEIVIRVVDTVGLENSGPAGCSFCGREVNDLSTLVQGDSAAICDGCIRAFSAAVKNGTALPLGASFRDEPEWVCGFCGRQPSLLPAVVVRNSAAVCAECLRTCSDLLEDRAGGERGE